MAAAFGFSVGDFLAGLELVGIVIDALRESGESSSQYRELIAQLYTLESALLRVKNLDLDDAQHAEIIALRQAAAQCQQTIDNFWKKIEKYQPSLRTGGSGNKVKDGWRKVQWALCKKDDIIKFRADLMGHTEAIHLLLATVQLNAIRINSKKTEKSCQSLVVQTRDAYSDFMQRMQAILSGVTTGLEQGRQLFKTTARILQTDVEVFKMVRNIQTIITRIPGQVDRQQPIHLIDALGHHRPFHLEFITSYQSFVYVLQGIFQDAGSGAARIANGGFVIQDLATQKDIALDRPWQFCFHPGQRLAMAIVFHTLQTTKNNDCPKCKTNNKAGTNPDIECSNCQLIYRQTNQVCPFKLMDFAVALRRTPRTGRPEVPEPSKEYNDRNTIEHELSILRRVRINSDDCPVKSPSPLVTFTWGIVATMPVVLMSKQPWEECIDRNTIENVFSILQHVDSVIISIN